MSEMIVKMCECGYCKVSADPSMMIFCPTYRRIMFPNLPPQPTVQEQSK